MSAAALAPPAASPRGSGSQQLIHRLKRDRAHRFIEQVQRRLAFPNVLSPLSPRGRSPRSSASQSPLSSPVRTSPAAPPLELSKPQELRARRTQAMAEMQSASAERRRTRSQLLQQAASEVALGDEGQVPSAGRVPSNHGHVSIRKSLSGDLPEVSPRASPLPRTALHSPRAPVLSPGNGGTVASVTSGGGEGSPRSPSTSGTATASRSATGHCGLPSTPIPSAGGPTAAASATPPNCHSARSAADSSATPTEWQRHTGNSRIAMLDFASLSPFTTEAPAKGHPGSRTISTPQSPTPSLTSPRTYVVGRGPDTAAMQKVAHRLLSHKRAGIVPPRGERVLLRWALLHSMLLYKSALCITRI